MVGQDSSSQLPRLAEVIRLKAPGATRLALAPSHDIIVTSQQKPDGSPVNDILPAQPAPRLLSFRFPPSIVVRRTFLSYT